MKKEKLEAIKHIRTILKAERFILTGGTVLALNGLKEDNNDIDIILVKPDESAIETTKRLMEESPAETKPYQGNSELIAIFKYGGYKFDIFQKEEHSEQTFFSNQGVEIDNVGHIIKAKKRINRMKDWVQLRNISRVFFKQEEFEGYLNSLK
jgi:hypothetical protein